MALRFVAPTGYQHGMKPGVEYTVIRNEAPFGRVLLVGFPEAEPAARKRALKKMKARKKRRLSQHPPKNTRYVAHLVQLPYAVFQEGLRPPKPGLPAALQPVRKKTSLPRWLAAYEGKNMDALPELTRTRPVKPLSDEEIAAGKQQRAPTSAKSETAARLARISVATEECARILESDDPDAELRALARATVPATNESRYRLWFYLHVAYDFNFWAVMPGRLEYGRWDRTDAVYADSLLGRNRIHHGGTPRCPTTKELRTAMADGFKKHAREKGTMTDAWSLTIRKDLGGRIEIIDVVLPDGRKRKRPAAFHKDGSPLPSPDKFRYHVIKELGIKFVRSKLKSRLRVEIEDEPIVGTQYQGLQFLGQQGNFDSHHVLERPKSYLGGGHLPPVMFVDLVDGAAGHIDAIGPGLGAEDAEGYKLALFCAAIDKPTFGKIVGIPISLEQWGSKGLHRALFSDRGPGASKAVREAVSPWRINAELARSFTPMDDAIVEAKHARKKKTLGAPTVVLSDLTVHSLFKREILRIIAKNHSDNALPRASDRAVVEHGANTPQLLRAALEADFRSSLVEISFADAVRQFLRRVEFDVLADGQLHYRGKVYASQEMHDCGLAKWMWQRRGKGLKVPGYLYWPATRFMWAEFDGRVIWVEKQSVDDALVTNCSDDELQMIQQARSQASGERQQMKPYTIAHGHQIFNDETGLEWHAGRHVRGPAKVSKEALDEVQRIKGLR